MSFKIPKDIQTKIKVFLIFLLVVTSANYFYQARYVAKIYSINIVLKDNFNFFKNYGLMNFEKWVKTNSKDYKYQQFTEDLNRCENRELGLDDSYINCISKILNEKEIHNFEMDMLFKNSLNNAINAENRMSIQYKEILELFQVNEANLRKLIQDTITYELKSNVFLYELQKSCTNLKIQSREKYTFVKCKTEEPEKTKKEIPIYLSQLWKSILQKQIKNSNYMGYINKDIDETMDSLFQVITSKSNYTNNQLKSIILLDAILIFCFVSYITLLTNRKKIT